MVQANEFIFRERTHLLEFHELVTEVALDLPLGFETLDNI